MILGSKVDKSGKKFLQVDKKKLAYVKQKTKELIDKNIDMNFNDQNIFNDIELDLENEEDING